MRDPWRLLRRSAPELPWRTRSRQTYSCQRPPRAGEALARALGGDNTRSMVDHGLAPARQRAARFTAMAHCLEHDVEEPKPTTKEVEEPTPRGTHSQISKLKDQRQPTILRLRNQAADRRARERVNV